MKNLLKITLITGVTCAAISVPVSAGNNFASLRGMFAPQDAIAEFEGRFDQPGSYTTPRQLRRLQAAEPLQQAGYNNSNYAPQGQTESVNYYSAEEYYGQNNYDAYNQFEGGFVQPQQNTSWQQRRLLAAGTHSQQGYQTSSQSYASPHRTFENNYPRQVDTRQTYKAPKASKYGNIYDYESGHCGSACDTAPSERIYQSASIQQQYTAPQVQLYKCWDGAITADYNGCNFQTKTIVKYKCWDGEIVTDSQGCKMQTTTRQVTRTRPSTQSSPYQSSTYQSSAYQSSAATAVSCPSGTSKQSDGTCLEFNSTPITSYGSSTDYNNSSSYSSNSISSFPTNCPSGTTAQSDGTCMEGGASGYSSPFTGSSVELFSDAQTSTQTVPPLYGYKSDNSYGPSTYLPIRK